MSHQDGFSNNGTEPCILRMVSTEEALEFRALAEFANDTPWADQNITNVEQRDYLPALPGRCPASFSFSAQMCSNTSVFGSSSSTKLIVTGLVKVLGSVIVTVTSR